MENYTATQLAYENGREKGLEEGREEAKEQLKTMEAVVEGLLGELKELEKAKKEVERLRRMVPRYSERDRIATMIQCSVGGCSRSWAETIATYLVNNGVSLGNGGEK